MLAIPHHHLVLRDPGNGFQEYLLHTFPGTEVRFTSLQYPRSSLRLLNMGMIFDFFFPQSSEASPDCHDASKVIESGLTY